MQIGGEDLDIYVVEGGWFCWILTPALRTRGAEEVRALNEKVVVRSEALLVGLLGCLPTTISKVLPRSYLSGAPSAIVLTCSGGQIVCTYLVRLASGGPSDILFLLARSAALWCSRAVLSMCRCRCRGVENERRTLCVGATRREKPAVCAHIK